MTEKSFARKNLAALDVKPVAEIRAEMARLTKAYVDLKQSGTASAVDLGRALDNLRAKNKALASSLSQPSKLTSARSLLGVKSSADISAEVRSLQSAYLVIKNSGVSSMRDVAAAQEALRKKTRELTGEQQRMKISILSGFVGKAGSVLLGALAAREVAGYANQVRKIADEYVNLNSRLKLVTDGEQDLAYVRKQLYDLSQETGTDFSANADSYAKLARAVRELGGDTDDTLQIVEMINKSLTINGSTTEMSASFMMQFAQAMGSGVLQGDEFRSMLENNSYFAAALAKELDTNIAGLRQMSKDGELTADVLRRAFPGMAKEISAEFSQIQPTVGRALTMLNNAFKSVVDESNQASGGTGKISASIIGLARTIEEHREGIVSIFSFIIDMAAGATDKVIRLGEAVGNIARSGSGWEAVFSGDLSFFEFATMNAKELNEWLKKNKKSAEEFGDTAKESSKKAADAAKESAGTMSKETKKALDEMKKKYQDYAKEIQRINADISGRTRSLYAELRDMARSGMSDKSAWEDQKKEAEEYARAAKNAAEEASSAMASGDEITATEKWKEALQYADDSKNAYKALNTEVKSGEQIVISQQQALKTSMEGVKESGKLGIEILKEQREATKDAMDSLSMKSGFADLADEMDGAEKKWLENWENMSEDTLGKIDKIDTKLDDVANKKRTATIVIDYEDGSRTVSRRSYAYGGMVTGYSPHPKADNISAMLTAREFVEPVSAVDHYQPWVFEVLRRKMVDRNSLHTFLRNGLSGLPHFAEGGPVNFSVGGMAVAQDSSQSQDLGTLNLSFQGGATIPVMTTKQLARKLLREFEQMGFRATA
ncbi:MAG: tape measure protein [Desulfobulbus sp.]